MVDKLDNFVVSTKFLFFKCAIQKREFLPGVLSVQLKTVAKLWYGSEKKLSKNETFPFGLEIKCDNGCKMASSWLIYLVFGRVGSLYSFTIVICQKTIMTSEVVNDGIH